jgi:hypothetical protein
VYAVLLVTRLSENELRLEIRDCTRRREDGTTISLSLNCRTRILRKQKKLTGKDDELTELQHGDVIHVCPKLCTCQHAKEYMAHKYVVSIPLSQTGEVEEAVRQLD